MTDSNGMAPPAIPLGRQQANQLLYLSYRAMPLDPDTGKRMTKSKAANLAGIDARTARTWAQDPNFATREREAVAGGIERARTLAKAGAYMLLNSSILVLAELLRDPRNVPAPTRANIAIHVMEWLGVAEPAELTVSGDPFGKLLLDLRAMGDDEEEEDEEGDEEEDANA